MIYANSPFEMATKIKPKIERRTGGSPNNKPKLHEPVIAMASIVITPDTTTKLVPIIDNAKCLLFSENIPPVKPSAKARIPKTPIKSTW